MSQTEAQIAFHNRIQRITQAQAEMMPRLDLAHHGQRSQFRAWIARAMIPPLMVFSLVLGAGAVFVTRWMRFLQSEAGLKYDMVVLDASITVIMLVVLSGIFQLRHRRYGRCMALGATTMMTMMHNLVWMFPFIFADLFSHAYVGSVKRDTDLGTIWLWVTSIQIPTF